MLYWRMDKSLMNKIRRPRWSSQSEPRCSLRRLYCLAVAPASKCISPPETTYSRRAKCPRSQATLLPFHPFIVSLSVPTMITRHIFVKTYDSVGLWNIVCVTARSNYMAKSKDKSSQIGESCPAWCLCRG